MICGIVFGVTVLAHFVRTDVYVSGLLQTDVLFLSYPSS